ncbi:MAG: hypothetical protein ACREIL_09220 [Nitrospiraceae bacterium]
MAHRLAASLGWIVLCVLLAACAVRPAPIVIYEDRLDSIWLKFDPEAGTGHDHPALLTPEQVAMILRGVRVRHRDIVGGFGLFADNEGAPAFSAPEITRVAPYLSQALKKASPKDMVTLYLTTVDPTLGKLVTSGGLFVRKDRLYFILANARTSPSSVQYENTYELDTRDEPLLPIARYKFTVGFTPDSARIPNAQLRGQKEYKRYIDESKLLVIDLKRLAEPEKSSTSPVPPPARPAR